jgi:hypothetical protein
VVWSDSAETPPTQWLDDFSQKDKKFRKNIQFEVHHNNSLSNRFRPLIAIPTAAVLTIDDDIIITCEDLSFLLHSWLVNQRLVSDLN